MKADYERAFKKAWEFANDGRRFALYALSLVFIGSVWLLAFLSIMDKGMASAGLEFVAAFVVTILFGVFIDGVLVHSFIKPKSMKENAMFVSGRFATLLGVIIFITILNWIANLLNLLPAGFLVSVVIQIVLALIFFYAYQEVLLSKRSFGKTLGSCWSIFTKHWLYVVITGLLVIIVSGLILIVSAIPLILFIAGNLVAIGAGEFSLAMIYSNIPLLFTSALSLLLGLTLAKLLGIGIITETYMQIKKK
ncbi:MAG: hypothetical protein HZB66_02145 [Candidatus Aenigmarchaeota archaeon]|nr:hypothetical protein [Candidatus Aenigmarchaeota archaeon]